MTAVEIDPTILYLGRRLHPERVYADPRTKAVVNDARTFIRQTSERFDTIIYGLLDSHTNLGAMTNVRARMPVLILASGLELRIANAAAQTRVVSGGEF